MMPEWPFWLGGTALAAVVALHLSLTRRLLSVSGRYSSLVDRLRERREIRNTPMADEELIAALRAATLEQFGPNALTSAPSSARTLRPRRTPAHHAVFFAALALGGLLGAFGRGGPRLSLGLHGEAAARTFGSDLGLLPTLLVGGLLVGFGTRMAGGCTSGHGLCGVSRAQPGSLLATATFFGIGIVTSLLLGALS